MKRTTALSIHCLLVAATFVTFSGCVRNADSRRPEPAVPAAGAKGLSASPEGALHAFLSAAEHGDFEAAHGLLAQSLRSRYSVRRLREDFAREPLAAERIARARRALQRPPVAGREVGEVYFPHDGGGAVRLILESDGYRVVSLE